MTNPISSKLLSIPPSGIRRFFDLASEKPDIISLSIGEPDFTTPQHIIDAGIASLRNLRTKYTSNTGLIELRQAVSRYLRRRQNLSYDPEREIIITVGGSEAIDIALRALIDPGDEVVVPQPCYVSFTACATLAGGTVVPIELLGENDYRLTPEQLRKALTPKTKVLLLGFPNNPTGGVMSREDYAALLPVLREFPRVQIISDELYSELIYTGEPPASLAHFPELRERIFYINGLSKSHAMTGWRVGYLCGPEEPLREMLKIHQYAIMCSPTTSQHAAVQALDHGDADIERMRRAYDERRKVIITALKEMGLEVPSPRGAFYAFPSIRRVMADDFEFCSTLLEEESVAVVPGSAFGDPGRGSVRISYAASLENIHIAMEKMGRFVTRRLK